MKAIHNSILIYLIKAKVVTDIKDTSFWKQFTTSKTSLSLFPSLLLISKIPHFESNSQLNKNITIFYYSCYWYQRYLILKAIHNISLWSFTRQKVVTDIKDTSFWKQFTTGGSPLVTPEELLLISKIPHFESNSQPIYANKIFVVSCYWYQRYLILKAIHNRANLALLSSAVVTDIKDTSFWKQFTTGWLENSGD